MRIDQLDTPRQPTVLRGGVERPDWKTHLRAAITDLRNSDRSPFEQQVYDALRVFAERQANEIPQERGTTGNWRDLRSK